MICELFVRELGLPVVMIPQELKSNMTSLYYISGKIQA